MAQAIPAYTMSVFKIPTRLCDDIQQSIFWVLVEQKKGGKRAFIRQHKRIWVNARFDEEWGLTWLKIIISPKYKSV